MKSRLLIITIILGLVSCKTTDFVGRYSMRDSNKYFIELKTDGTFEFIDLIPYNSNYNDGNCIISSGTWAVKKGKLTLNSYRDLPETQRSEIIEIREDLTKVDTGIWAGTRFPLSYSTFTFYDIQGDTIDILSGDALNGSGISKLHSSMKYFRWPTLPDISDYNYTLGDTMEFHFWGYRPFKFIRSDRIRRIVKVKIYPDKAEGIFRNKEFMINRRRIKDSKTRFVKKNQYTTE